MDRLFNPKASQILLATAVPTALAACAMPTSGQVFLNEAQALQVIFGPDVTATRDVKSLTGAQRRRLEQSSGLHFPESSYTFLVAARQHKLVGYGLVIDEIGKSEPITFMVGMGVDGKVIDVAFMVFRETRGAEVKEKRFLRQFHGKRIGDPVQIDRDIINYSGATLSSKALARGVKRALLLFEEFYPPGERHLSERRSAPLSLLPMSPISTVEGTQTLFLYRQARYRMGTVCELRAWAPSEADASRIFAAGFEEIARLDRMFSNYREDSELTHVNRTAVNTRVEVSLEFWKLLHHAVRWWRVSKGTFDVTVRPLLRAWGFCDGQPRMPSANELACATEMVGSDKLELGYRTVHFRKPGMELDFGGLAKGYAADRAAEKTCQAGSPAALVNIGRSSISVAGCSVSRPTSPHGASLSADPASGLAVGEWPIVIADQAGITDWSSCLVLHSGWSLATSGSCEQSFSTHDGRFLTHITDPRTGWPIGYPCSASAISRSGLRTESLTKALLLLDGRERHRLWRDAAKNDWVSVRRGSRTTSRTWEPRQWPNLLIL